MTLLADIAAYIAAGGFGTVGVDIWEGTMPAAPPETAMSIEPYAGRAPEYTFDVGMAPARDYPRVALHFRDAPNDFQTPWNRANAVYTYLLSAWGVVINGTHYLRLAPLQPPFSLGQPPDMNLRYLVCFNVEAVRALP